MRYRYRALVGRTRFDFASFWAGYRAKLTQDASDLREHSRLASFLLGPWGLVYLLPLAAALRLFGIVGVLFTATKDVQAREGEADATELEAMLRRGALKADDLVHAEGGWQTFRQSVAFEDTCFQLEKQARPFRLAASGMTILLGMLLLVGVGWTIFSIPDLIMASAR